MHWLKILDVFRERPAFLISDNYSREKKNSYRNYKSWPGFFLSLIMFLILGAFLT